MGPGQRAFFRTQDQLVLVGEIPHCVDVGIHGANDLDFFTLTDEVIDRKSEDVLARVRELTDGAGVPVLYDSVGKDSYEQSIDCLAPRGFFVSFGTTSGKVPPVDAATLQHKGSLYFTRPTLADYCAARSDFEASAARVFDMVASGAVAIEIGQRYNLEDAVQAHSELEGGRTSGSSILIP